MTEPEVVPDTLQLLTNEVNASLSQLRQQLSLLESGRSDVATKLDVLLSSIEEAARQNVWAKLEELRPVLQSVCAEPTPSSLEWYKLHRAHELELNRATLQYEHERIKFLAYLNGGAVGVSLTFLGSAKAQGSTLGFLPEGPFLVAVAFWTAGLLFAWFAWVKGHASQSAFTTAFRMRRYGYERTLRGGYDFGIRATFPPKGKFEPLKVTLVNEEKSELTLKFGKGVVLGQKLEFQLPASMRLGSVAEIGGPDDLTSAANQWGEEATSLGKCWKRWSSASLLCFALGAVLSLLLWSTTSQGDTKTKGAAGASTVGTSAAGAGGASAEGTAGTAGASSTAGTSG